MKAVKTKDGKLQIKVKKSNPIISDYKNPKVDEKAAREFGKTLRSSGERVESLKQVSSRKYIDTRPSLNKK